MLIILCTLQPILKTNVHPCRGPSKDALSWKRSGRYHTDNKDDMAGKMKSGFICWMREIGFSPLYLICKFSDRKWGIDSEFIFHPHVHIWKHRPCWLIQASSSSPMWGQGGWSNPVIGPNRCCWQNNRQGASKAARLEEVMSQTHHSSSRIAGWLQQAGLVARHTHWLSRAERFAATAVPEWLVNGQFHFCFVCSASVHTVTLLMAFAHKVCILLPKWLHVSKQIPMYFSSRIMPSL